MVEGFKKMRDRSKVGYFGFSGLGEVTALHQLVDSGEFHGFQAYYNLLNPSAGQPVHQGFSALDYRVLSIAQLPMEWAPLSFVFWRRVR